MSRAGKLGVVKGNDPFRLEGPEEYSVERFYTAAYNQHNHTSKQTLYLKPELMAEVSVLLNAGKIPEYKTFQDLVRDSIHHRVEWLRERIDDPRFDEFVQDERRRAEQADDRREAQLLADEVQELEATLTAAGNIGDKVLVGKTLDRYEDSLDRFREPFRTKVEELLERFKRHLK